MSKYFLLDQLRNDYQRKEEEIKAPVIKALNEERREKESAIRKYHDIEFKLGQDVINYSVEEAKRQIAFSMSKQFAELMHKAGAYNENEDFIFKIDKRFARLASPDKLMQEFLNNYTSYANPSLNITTIIDTKVELIEIKIPSFNLRLFVNK